MENVITSEAVVCNSYLRNTKFRMRDIGLLVTQAHGTDKALVPAVCQ